VNTFQVWALERPVGASSRVVRHGRYVVFQLAEGGGAPSPVRRDPAEDCPAAAKAAAAPGIENGSTRAASAKGRVLRGVSGWLEPSEPWLARRNGISSAFRSRHMGNVGSYGRISLQPTETRACWSAHQGPHHDVHHGGRSNLWARPSRERGRSRFLMLTQDFTNG
jgi:hypothetical protein